MIPVLYTNNEVDFTSCGVGLLTEAISCTVTEDTSGIFECALQYPVTGKLFQEMVDNGGIIYATHSDSTDKQPFDIYGFSAPINGIVTFYAHHVSYRLSNIVVRPFEAESCAGALAGIKTNSANSNPFEFWTNKVVSSPYSLTHPENARSLLSGREGSILDVYGKGDYEFDMFNVKLYVKRGRNTDVTIRYGKNMVDIKRSLDESEVYNAIAPYWADSETTVYLPEIYVTSPDAPAGVVPSAVDFTAKFDEAPTEEALRNAAVAYLSNNKPWIPVHNIYVSFVQLWQTTEYENVALLQRVSLYDTVSVYYPELGVTQERQRVVKTVYNVLLDRYDSMELGELNTTLYESISKSIDKKVEQKASISMVRETVGTATDMITGGLGGYVVIKMNELNKPEELLILDTPDIATAVNVWRWNRGGLGHSSNGYNGPYDDVAITQDGAINASRILTGVLNGDAVRAKNLIIIDDNDNVLATFNDAGIVLGLTTQSHAELDFNSFELIDKNGKVYFSVGDLRDENGLFTVTDTVSFGYSSYTFYTTYYIQSVDSVTVDGVTVGSETYSNAGHSIVFTNELPANTIVEIVYKTAEEMYRYDLGKRKSGSNVGAWSIANGKNSEASKNYSTVSGGSENTASGIHSTVSGGYLNTASSINTSVGGGEYNAASSDSATVGGGSRNTASGGYATVSGGGNNTASGNSATVCGGAGNTASGEGATVSGVRNTASGRDSSVIGGVDNTASGDYSTVVGGHANEAARKSQTVFGEYNAVDSGDAATRGNYVEIVGNGTSNSNRSNARTLDWNGNETLAGKLTLGADGTNDMDAVTLRQFNELTAAAYTPTFTFSASGEVLTVKNIDAKYFIFGRVCFISMRFNITDLGTHANNENLRITLPNDVISPLNTTAPVGVYFTSAGPANLVVRVVSGANYLNIVNAIGGSYSAPVITTGYQGLFAVIFF